MASLNFNAQNVAPQTAYEPVPAGDYLVMITDSEMCPTKANNGSYLKLTLTILDGQFAKRKLYDNLNLNNPNPTAVEIAMGRLSAYCHAVNVIQVNDSQQLHGIPLMAKVRVKADASGQYGPSNEVSGVGPVPAGYQPGAVSTQPNQPMQPPAPPAPPAAPAGWGQPPQQPAQPPVGASVPQPAPQPAPAEAPQPTPEQIAAFLASQAKQTAHTEVATPAATSVPSPMAQQPQTPAPQAGVVMTPPWVTPQ